MNERYILYKCPASSPADYYNVESNTINDIIGVFKTKQSAIDYAKENNLKLTQIAKIYWEE